MNSLVLIRFYLISSILIGVSYTKLSLLPCALKIQPFDYKSIMSPYCDRLVNVKTLMSKGKSQMSQKDKMEDFCEKILLKKRLVEEAKLKKEKEDKIYRTHLASRVKSSFVNDFLTMRYK